MWIENDRFLQDARGTAVEGHPRALTGLGDLYGTVCPYGAILGGCHARVHE